MLCEALVVLLLSKILKTQNVKQTQQQTEWATIRTNYTKYSMAYARSGTR